MATVIDRTGTIFKKCGRKGHKPNSNKRCAAGACQHTCENPEKCSHAWTLRYSAGGKQREASFHDEIRSGRTVYGSGEKLAQDFQLKLTLDKRAGEKTFPDYGKSSKASFGDAAEAFISHKLPSWPMADLIPAAASCSRGRHLRMAHAPMPLKLFLPLTS